jgi:ubiquinone/menaquinone biosynthesis C-methylase UbiE
LNQTESKYVEKRNYLLRLARSRELASRAAATPLHEGFSSEAEWLRCVRDDYPRFIPFLTKKCGVQFRGRVLEIGAGAAWFSAELSKLPKVVEVVVTDFSPERLKADVPKILRLLKANASKITRTPTDFQKLDYPDNYFDFVVCSAVLHHTVNMVAVLREARRVLKPSGQMVAIREPVWPLLHLSSSSSRRAALIPTRDKYPRYTLAEYREFFVRAGFAVNARRANLATGLKYYFDKVVNGFTHARYVFVATKRGKR